MYIDSDVLLRMEYRVSYSFSEQNWKEKFYDSLQYTDAIDAYFLFFIFIFIHPLSASENRIRGYEFFTI